MGIVYEVDFNDTVMSEEFFGEMCKGFYLHSYCMPLENVLFVYIRRNNKIHKCKPGTMVRCRTVLVEKYTYKEY